MQILKENYLFDLVLYQKNQLAIVLVRLEELKLSIYSLRHKQSVKKLLYLEISYIPFDVKNRQARLRLAYT